MTDAEISSIFSGAGDFIRKELRCGEFTLYAYAIDGLVSSSDAAENIFEPIFRNLRGDSMESLYDAGLRGAVYNTVVSPCKDTNDMTLKLVNGFCVTAGSGRATTPDAPSWSTARPTDRRPRSAKSTWARW